VRAVAGGWQNRTMRPELGRKLGELENALRRTGGVVVAFSGGADSALVAAVAGRVLGERAVAVTAVSPSLPPGELEDARAFARALGLRHRAVRTRELERAAYRANSVDRCFHCKTELYDVLSRVAGEEGLPHVASGTNADDLVDVRPGLAAAAERGVLQPLADAGLTKEDVREASRALGLPTWDKPASACLSSRVAYGLTITVEGLARIGLAERALKDLGFRQVRVRDHGDIARIEVDGDDVARLAQVEVRGRVIAALKDLGFRFVTVDLEGFRSGSMNPPPAEGGGP